MKIIIQNIGKVLESPSLRNIELYENKFDSCLLIMPEGKEKCRDVDGKKQSF
jgi:hypothetical protein